MSASNAIIDGFRWAITRRAAFEEKLRKQKKYPKALQFRRKMKMTIARLFCARLLLNNTQF
jgi:hypothetical protein